MEQQHALHIAPLNISLSSYQEDDSCNSLVQTPDSLQQHTLLSSLLPSLHHASLNTSSAAPMPHNNPLLLPSSSGTAPFPPDIAAPHAQQQPQQTQARARASSANQDGYQWRKYGEKLVKGSVNPRSYYKCSTANCPARKTVERAGDVVSAVEYKHQHNHQAPTMKTAKQRKALPPKHTQQPSNTYVQKSQPPAPSPKADYTTGGGSFVTAEASGTSSAATTFSMGSEQHTSSLPFSIFSSSNTNTNSTPPAPQPQQEHEAQQQSPWVNALMQQLHQQQPLLQLFQPHASSTAQRSSALQQLLLQQQQGLAAALPCATSTALMQQQLPVTAPLVLGRSVLGADSNSSLPTNTLSANNSISAGLDLVKTGAVSQPVNFSNISLLAQQGSAAAMGGIEQLAGNSHLQATLAASLAGLLPK